MFYEYKLKKLGGMYADDNKVVALNKPDTNKRLRLDIYNTVEWCC